MLLSTRSLGKNPSRGGSPASERIRIVTRVLENEKFILKIDLRLFIVSALNILKITKIEVVYTIKYKIIRGSLMNRAMMHHLMWCIDE